MASGYGLSSMMGKKPKVAACLEAQALTTIQNLKLLRPWRCGHHAWLSRAELGQLSWTFVHTVALLTCSLAHQKL
eukprot:4369208-Amphidinium_carterae.1